jgi:branched-chain amino acid transport system permease protein
MPDVELSLILGLLYKPYLVLGLALGGVFAMSGVGLVVLYRATGVLNLAYGAIGAVGALTTWSILDATGTPEPVAYLTCVALGGAATLVYGVIFGPPFAARDPLVKAVATLGFLLILLGLMQWVWGREAHSITLPTSRWNYEIGDVRVSWTQIIGLAFPIVVTAGTAFFLRGTKLGTAMRSLANDREVTAMLGVPVRRVEAAAWLGSGLVCGAAGLLLSNLVGLDMATLTFLVIPALSAALIGQLRSLWVTLVAGIVIGVLYSFLNTFSALADYRTITPFVVAIVALLWFARRPQVIGQT